MWRNLKFFEDNKCGDIFTLLNEYLENLITLNNELKKDIAIHRKKVIQINALLEKGIEPPIEDLIINNSESVGLLKKQKLIKYKILEVNSVMNKYILDDKRHSLKFFKRVLTFYIEREDYKNCRIIQNVIDLLVQ
jgi:hypothetical protein